MKDTYILGISAFYHNSAAALVKNGKVVVACEEERFTRKKGDSSFPINAIIYCIEYENISFDDIQRVVYYEDSAEKFGRILTNSQLTAPMGISQFLNSVPVWINNKLWVQKKIAKELGIKTNKIVSLTHHLSHAAAAFYPSPFDSAAVLTVDGVGEWTTTAWGVCKGAEIDLREEIRFPNSLGLLYSAFTFYTGFKINSGEYKMMGLAPYGKPIYADLIKSKLVKIGEDGSFVLNLKYFGYTKTMKTVNAEFEKLFGRPARKPESEIDPFYADVAASIQDVTNEIILKMAKSIKEKTGEKNLVLSGGVALNITAMGKLRESGIFENIWIQPAAGDAGSALGAALYTYYSETGSERQAQDDFSAFLGLEIADNDEKDDEALKNLGGIWTVHSPEDLAKKIAKILSKGHTVAVARGKAEFGPRALGNRSVLADARDPDMLRRLNLEIKFREGFRPFAPAVLEENAADYFDINGTSPYMLFSFPVKEERRKDFSFCETITETAGVPRSDIPAVTHVDYSARVQTVGSNDSDFFCKILQEYKKLTKCAVLVNTSFNVRGEPIVNDVEDAYRCFMKSGLDFAVIGNRLFSKIQQQGGADNAGE